MTKTAQRLALASALLIGAPAFAQTTANALPEWMNKVSLGGDFRFRLNQENNNSVQDTSEVIRVRLGLNAKVNESLTANFRFASAAGTNTITSSNQDLTGFNSKKPYWIDIASIDWKAFDGATLTLGKAVNPFFTAGKNEMVWDADLTLEGVNAKYQQEFGAFRPFAAIAYTVINEVSGTTNQADVTLLGAQIGTGFKSDIAGATLAASLYNYNNLQGTPVTAIPTTGTPSSKGNTLDASSAFAYEYRLTNVELELTTDAVGIPLTAYGAWVRNSEPSDLKDGWLGGARIGKLKELYSWALDYNYRDLQKDATVGVFTDSDFAGGGTDVRGHKVAFQFVPLDGTTLSATAFFNNRNISAANTYYEKYLLEAVATF